MCQPRDDLTGDEAAEAHLDKSGAERLKIYMDVKEKAVSNDPETALCDHEHSGLTTASSPITGFAGPCRAIFPLDAIAPNVAAQPTLPIARINVAAPADL